MPTSAQASRSCAGRPRSAASLLLRSSAAVMWSAWMWVSRVKGQAEPKPLDLGQIAVYRDDDRVDQHRLARFLATEQIGISAR